MPYSAAHKAETRRHIVETARILFNREGFAEVSIDRIMAEAGLTRGGFYNHFQNKDELYAEAIASFLKGRKESCKDESADPSNMRLLAINSIIENYLSTNHLDDLDAQCPMIALPSDAARASQNVRAAYTDVVRAMATLFEANVPKNRHSDEQALALVAMCVGGMVLARTIDDQKLADDIRSATKKNAFATIATNP